MIYGGHKEKLLNLDTCISLEKNRWREVPEQLLGEKFSSVDELMTKFGKNPKFDDVFTKVNRRVEGGRELEVYSRKTKITAQYFKGAIDTSGTVDFAYGCNSCKKIVIGPPAISGSVNGKVSLECACVNCNNSLYLPLNSLKED